MAERPVSIDLEAVARRLPTREMLPWTSEQLVALVAANALGFLLMAVGWWQTLARGDSASDQLGWINLAILGVLVSGCANVLWLARGRRVVTLAKTAVIPHSWIRSSGASDDDDGSLGGIWSAVPGLPVHTPSSNGAQHQKSLAVASGEFLAADAMTRYHRPGCVLVEGKDAFASDAASHAAAGRAPCEICQP